MLVWKRLVGRGRTLRHRDTSHCCGQPVRLVWSIATLLGREPEYTRWTWLAAFLVMCILGRSSQARAK